MADLPKAKGVVMRATVDALQARPDSYRAAVPPELAHYFHDHIHINDWYPVEDMIPLLRAMSGVDNPGIPQDEVFEFFGALAVQRDLFGNQDWISEELRTSTGGAYLGAISKDLDFRTFISRAAALWMLYFDMGEQQVERTGPRSLTVRRTDCTYVSPSLCAMTTGFYREVMKVREVRADLVKSKCTARGDAFCEWTLEYPVGTEPEQLAVFDSTPPAG